MASNSRCTTIRHNGVSPVLSMRCRHGCDRCDGCMGWGRWATAMSLLDLIGREVPLHRVASTHGGEYAGPCPWCGGRDRFRVWPHAERPGYWCRRCGQKGDGIQYLRERDGLSFAEACDRLCISLKEPSRQTRVPEPPGYHWLLGGPGRRRRGNSPRRASPWAQKPCTICVNEACATRPSGRPGSAIIQPNAS